MEQDASRRIHSDMENLRLERQDMAASCEELEARIEELMQERDDSRR